MVAELRTLKVLFRILGVRIEVRWIHSVENLFVDALYRNWNWDPGDAWDTGVSLK